MSWTFYKDVILDTVKDKALLSTDSSGKVVGHDQAAAVADATGTLPSVTLQLNDLLAKLRTMGVIGT